MHICGFQNNSTDDLICKTEIETQTTNTGHQVGKGGGGMNWKIRIDLYTLLILCVNQITNENLLYTSAYSVLCGNLNGKEIQKRGDTHTHTHTHTYRHTDDSVCSTVEIQHCKPTITPIKLILKKQNNNKKSEAVRV